MSTGPPVDAYSSMPEFPFGVLGTRGIPEVASAAYSRPDQNLNPPRLGNFQALKSGNFSVDNDITQLAVAVRPRIIVIARPIYSRQLAGRALTQRKLR
jgi:hypothetical protein